MEELVKAISVLVGEEYQRAAAEHGGAANTPHEGYALTKEEVDEAREQMDAVCQNITDLWCAVKADDLPRQRAILVNIRRAAILGACELIQVAAMADKSTQGLVNPGEGKRQKIGLWREHRYGTTLDPSCVQYYCSVCGKVQEDFATNYCPNCGTAMVAVEKEGM